MKIENPLPGEEEELQKKLRKAKRKYGQIPPEEEEKIAKQVHNKIERTEKVKKTFRRILAALGLSVAIGGATATVATISEHNKQIEQEESNSAKKRQEFAQQYQQEGEIVNEERNYKNEINNIKNEEELENYINELYIEERKEIMGDTLLKADSIKIDSNYANFLFQDQKTGKLITHGDYPDVTKEELTNNYNMEITGYGDNERLYEVLTDEGRIIDCMTMQDVDGEYKPVKVYNGNDYQNYKSILTNMGQVIPAGISYKERFDDEGEKQNFIKAVEEWKENTKETSIENQKQEEGPEL